jgi:hypothetical protein
MEQKLKSQIGGAHHLSLSYQKVTDLAKMAGESSILLAELEQDGYRQINPRPFLLQHLSCKNGLSSTDIARHGSLGVIHSSLRT